MAKRKKGFRIGLVLLCTMFVLSACSMEELLTVIPQTLGAEQDAQQEPAFGQEDAAEQEPASGQPTEVSTQEEGGFAKSSFLSENADTYAYNNLPPEQQLWYQDIAQALGSMQETVTLSKEGLDAGLDGNCIDRIFQSVLMGHPELFFVDGYTYTKYTRGEDTVSLAFSGSYEMTAEEAGDRKLQIEEAADLLLAEVPADASDYDKVKYVYDTIIKNTSYDLHAPDNQNIYSVLVGNRSVCQGYAKAAQYLLNRLGVECTLVQGQVNTGEGHAWNLVRVDGSFYYMDVTWGDASYQTEGTDGAGTDESGVDGPESDKPETDIPGTDTPGNGAAAPPEINYDYLCITTKQLLQTHTPQHSVPLPECVDTAANYYVRQNALFEGYDREQMKQFFQTALESGRTDMAFQCADAGAYQEVKEALIDGQEIFDYLPAENGTVCYACNEKQLSLTFWMTNQ